MTEQELRAKAMFIFAEYGVLDKIVMLHVSEGNSRHHIVFGHTTDNINDNNQRWSIEFDRKTGAVKVVDYWDVNAGWVKIHLRGKP